MPNYSTKVRAIRTAYGYTQAELGRAIGVHGTCISDWERGNSRPTKHNYREQIDALYNDPVVRDAKVSVAPVPKKEPQPKLATSHLSRIHFAVASLIGGVVGSGLMAIVYLLAAP